MIWDRWRRSAQPDGRPSLPGPFEDLLEHAPVAALLVDGANRVFAMNEAAARFFGTDRAALPAGFIEATREGSLLGVLRSGAAESEVELVHSRRTVKTKVVPGPAEGDSLLFVSDVTELRRLERVRQEFVANLSHELKTPVTSLRLAVESLGGAPDGADRRKLVEHALKEADHLTAVIENLRRLAALEAGEVKIEVSEFPLAQAVGDVVSRLGLEERVRLEIEAGILVAADREMLAQALANLLDNAARFSPADAEVKMAAAREDHGVVIRVVDHGPGIAPEHWERVFERFYKVDPARTRQAGGTGLGLAITKHLMQAQGGRVWTEAGDDSGQVFLVWVPTPS
ncbi:MAG TPA: ATP-binding protein [Candidatus Dormibacteraeota bacterium]